MPRKIIVREPRWVDEWTEEAEKIARHRGFMHEFAWRTCRVVLTGGLAPITGFVHGSLSQPRFLEGRGWQYRGSIWIDSDDRSIEVDFLDVGRAEIV